MARAVVDELEEVVSEVDRTEVVRAASESRGRATEYQGPKDTYRPWATRSKGIQTSPFYSPNDFQRSRRVVDPARERDTEPSGLGPSASIARRRDQFHNLGINIVNEFRNATLMSDFVTSMGMIKKRGETGLTRRNQRMLAKAIKRSQSAGIIPQYSKPTDIQY
ncbi:hypothetical protein FRB94_007026 [Tulasnella sp. JGI-2019a]|nr:hypothetical protein FRB94_007026 [Tulasnella sp. JGI-2019a]KAG9016939.1 hypothetical protein FRB93_009469 [Tulasnella sp. JGI-2019a]KAG9040166.1 hypothetical protein FRB95_000095 [Tulasnella sp. JGI-2019a]